MGVHDLKAYTMSSESLFYSPQQCLLTVNIIMEMLTYMFVYVCVCIYIYKTYTYTFLCN